MKRAFLTLVAIVALLLPAGPVLAASCKGNSHEPTLTNGAATPGSGVAPASVTFRVRYADTGGCIPTYVSVEIAGVGTLPMSTAETDLIGGVTYLRTVALSAGNHAYSFVARSGAGGGDKTVTLDSVSPSSVQITAPTPKPTPNPTPKPTPRPTPKPTRKPTPAPTAAPAAQAPVAPAAPATTPSAKATSAPKSTPAPSSSPEPASASPSTDGVPPAAPEAPPKGAPDGSSAPSGKAAGFAGGLEGTLNDLLRITGVVAVAAMVLLWLLIRQRRRDEPATAAAALAAAAPTATATTPEAAAEAASVAPVTPLPPMRELIPPVDPTLLDDDGDRVQPRADEANTPRWLRQSLREARFADHRYRERGWADPLDN
ncbi:MAG TPA: hypothetical protein VFW95_12430 [Candidatus Limnocylindria bacterium]|nr:hypothetical protein [Candidatus Limnocylindria bacterium]